jgi:hypothetical protein
MDGLRDILIPCLWSTLLAGIKAHPAVWAFKWKQLPDWTFIKCKAWLNVHGGWQQESINFWETYAPVVHWSTVQLVLTLSLLNNFKTQEVDFIQDFIQAPLDCLIYMEVPPGLVSLRTNYVSLVKPLTIPTKATCNSLPKTSAVSNSDNWHKSLHDELISVGFHQSRVDKCLFWLCNSGLHWWLPHIK